MAEATILEYKCPSCDAGLVFGGEGQLRCDYCGNSYPISELEALQAHTETAAQPQTWGQEEQERLNCFQCPSCGGEILTEDTTAATFCPYCGNPSVLPARLSGALRPDGVLPFQKPREEAAAAFSRLCRGKPLLPGAFRRQQLEKLTGVYVPFWLFDCRGEFEGRYKSTTVRRWSDAHYHYTRTSYFHVERNAVGRFRGIPMDASTKMPDALMEALEPFDYSAMEPFDMAYLTGYLADQYDVPAEDCGERIRERISATMEARSRETVRGYATTVPTHTETRVTDQRQKYVLLPVWMCSTRYRGKVYTFAMNGQTGKLVGDLPVSWARAAAWFAGIFCGVTALATAALWYL